MAREGEASLFPNVTKTGRSRSVPPGAKSALEGREEKRVASAVAMRPTERRDLRADCSGVSDGDGKIGLNSDGESKMISSVFSNRVSKRLAQ